MATHDSNAPHDVLTIEDRIHNFFDRVIACANYRRMALIEEVNNKRLEMAERVKQRELGEKQLLVTKAEIEKKLKENLLRTTQEQLLKKIEGKLAEVRIPQPEKRLSFRADFERLEQLILTLGEVFEEEVPTTPNYQQMRQIVTVGKEGRTRGELSNPRGVAIDPNSNRIFVTEQNPARISIFSESGAFVDSFSHEHMQRPHGIAVHRDNVYISDTGAQGVFHYKIEADMRLKESLLGEGSLPGEFYVPGQLAISEDGLVFVTDSTNHRVQVLNESLYIQRSITHDTLHYPEDVKLTNDEVYVLSSRDSPCVHVFSYAGEKIRAFITSGIQGMQVNTALFFCLDANKNVIISDCGTNDIRVFSQDGTLITTVEGFQGGTSYNPQGIALTKDAKLVVIAPNDTFHLQIYSS